MGRKYPIAENEFYHVYNRGTDRRTIFLDEHDKERFVKLLYLANSEGPVVMENLENLSFKELVARGAEKTPLTAIGAYCLMPNHFHIFAKETAQGGITKFMRKLLTGYVMYFNKRHERSGGLFGGRFKATRVTDDNYLRYLFAYIHLNPVKLVDALWKDEGIQDIEHAREYLSRYAHSSYFDFTGTDRPQKAILDRSHFPEYFADTHEFSSFINDWLELKEKKP
ncbi:MAG: hypothetical protein A3G11_00570 [Candidatus Lloydbacteria bacterium RIFCSPLOWO2_12_FULL_51_9]|uniref:Transposase IS200-like domain-containing protein n=1 Tax=Candidatus Lloydbacteria bacterium RIFCSPLOWO2_12_FULL_51_9 TaxID=1798669 RepID=A0A1G2DTM6_9BACT|nr:MAG: hypothetical protein A3G11_00570 [Candidatus Lloydbacteria bacterium RIFCSPLOWO2_12_FULL_51_9]